MLMDTAKGRSLAYLQSIYSSYHVSLAELENFVSHKTSMDLDYVQISKMGFDTCMNAKFQFCKAGKNQIAKNKAKLKSGSGFFVSQAGHILTNEHVAGNCQNILIEPQGIKATLIDTDSKFDLALLKVDDTTQESANFRENESVLVSICISS